MTKGYFSPAAMKGFLPKMSGRRFSQMAKSGGIAYRSDAEVEKEHEALIAKIRTEIQKDLASRATKEEIAVIQQQAIVFKEFSADALREILDKDKGVLKMLVDQGLKIAELEKRGTETKEDMSIRGQIAKWQKDNETQIRSIQDGSSKMASLSAMVIDFGAAKRAVASPMLPSNTWSGAYLPNAGILPGLMEAPQAQPNFWNFLKKGRTKLNPLIWINKVNKQGAAAFIAPGVYKPGVSFEIETETSTPKKVAVNTKVAVETLHDIDKMEGWIIDNLLYELDIKTNEQVMIGVGSSTNPAGIQTLSTTFLGASLGVHTVNPNIWDCLDALTAQLRFLRFKGRVVHFINPIDYTNAKITKALNQGQRFLAAQLDSTIVEDDNVPVGYVQSAIIENYKIDIFEDVAVQWGLENDDLTKNLRTVIAERRFHQYVSNSHSGSFIYDTFENIMNGIREVEA